MKNVVIFGSSGNVGQFCVETAVNQGLNVRVLLRDPSKLPSELRSKVEVLTGDVTNSDDVQNAVSGQDAVIVTLGTRTDLGPTTAMSEGMKNIVLAMKAHSVELVSVCLSAFLFYEPSKVPAIFHEVNADHQRMYDVLKDCDDLKWVGVFPGHFTDEPRGVYIVKHDASPGRTIAKRDLAAFLIDSLSTPENYRKRCGIASQPKQA